MKGPTRPPTSAKPDSSKSDSSSENTHLDEFMRALLGPGASIDDPNSDDVESRLARVLSDVGLLPDETTPPVHVNGTKAHALEPPQPEHSTIIWRGTTVTRPASSGEAPKAPPRRWRWRGTSPDRE